ncbi:NAD(P)-dependent oxidoreductase [Sphingomonas sp. BIUV-7]|uniref:NAD(P)-dependent oxidoreductase n=1 Tax=Sphingomonas natans TaxID=3063330 RepID=A0ABT8Y6D7_9SPHN|nr:NAD(P)-dependent oxidoreductase [Sphingomonas sp. BIUV-7]MDO6413891.1 NAD(P)-dependent oxidoreductase [Sphingomonas sp. BIUV-7]
MRVAILGLGNMGGAIARNILKAGHDLTVWNRSPDKAAALVEGGATLATTPAEAAAQAEIVFTMLADDRAVEAVTFGEDGLLAADPLCLHVGLSTVSLALARRLAEAQGDRYVSAPVFGRPPAAEAAQLSIVAAGAPASIAHAQPVFDAIGQKTFVVGEDAPAANLVKLCGNFMIMSAIEAMGEAMALAAKNGLDKQALFDVLTGTLFGAPVYRNYGPALIEGTYRPAGFPAPLGLKDMNLVAEAATGARVPMPLLGVIRDHLLQAIARDGDDVDWSAIGKAIGDNAGL